MRWYGRTYRQMGSKVGWDWVGCGIGRVWCRDGSKDERWDGLGTGNGTGQEARLMRGDGDSMGGGVWM